MCLPNVCLECSNPINPDETYCRRCLQDEGMAQIQLRAPNPNPQLNLAL